MKKIPTMMDSLAQLVAQPSVSSVDPTWDQSNRNVIDLLANWLEALGFDIELMPLATTDSTAKEKFNLIARMGEGEQGMVLSGHTDTVAFNADRWDQDPFKLTEKEGCLYGLGVCDMKSFFPIIMEVVQQLDRKDLQQPLYVLATADEESSMAGARALTKSGRTLGRHALIGEPTNLVPIYMHKGILMEAIKIIGRAGHSSDPSLGNNAIEGMQNVIDAIMKWRDTLQTQYTDPRFSVPQPTINLGTIHGGDNTNRICAECELTIDIRLTPEMSLEKTRNDMRALISETLNGTGLRVEYRSIFDGIPGFITDLNAEIIRMAEKFSGVKADTVTFGTEGPYLNAMRMDTVILGPGNIAQAHQANEYLALDRIPPMIDILTNMIDHFCLRSH